MKKLISIAAALAVFGLTACNNELGPEYKTPPSVSDLTITPAIAPTEGNTQQIDPVYEGQDVTFSGYYTNTYGQSVIYLIYRTMTPAESDGKSDTEIDALWRKKFFNEENEAETLLKTYDSPMERSYFMFTIAGQPAGTKVRWDFGFYNSFSLGAPGYVLYNEVPPQEYREFTVLSNEPAAPQEPVGE